MKLSLGLIMQSEIDQFKRILDSYHWMFDEVVVAVDEKLPEFEEVAKAYPKTSFKIIPYVWKDDFGDKRNVVHKNVTGDYYVRLDADDAFGNGCAKDIRKIAEESLANDISVVYGYYNYSRDEWGNTNAAQWREVLIRNTDNLFWNKKIHENLLPKNPANHKIDIHDGLVIDHLIDDHHTEKSLQRNIVYLLKEYNEDKENADPRTVAYLGRMLAGIRQFDKAIYFLEKHIQKSGWDEDRYMSWCQLADCYLHKENFDQATAAAFEALQECPDYPDAYLKLHDIYFNQEKWDKAEHWGRIGLLKPVPKNFMMIDPSAYGWRPILSMAFTLFQNNKFDEALKMFYLAKKDVPGLDFVTQNEGMFVKAVEHKKFMEHFLATINFLKDKDEENKIPILLEAVPKEFDENEIIIKLRHHYSEPKQWGDKTVCIFALNSLTDWSPKSVDGGIGGSEEAVIYLSKELVALGWDVTVFNNCGEQAGVYDGVTYKHILNFSPKDHYNILISWRSNIFESNVQAKKRIVWLHDMPNIKLEDDNIKKVDKFVLLSKYHASLLPSNVPAEKVFISTNGINASDFVGLGDIKREPHRCIYASSYNRGLEQLLLMWPDVRKAVPDAELHIYYGWDTYDSFSKMGFVKDGGFKKKMIDLMCQPGVTDHGRVGHKELLKEYAKSGVFAYPCSYPGEINCIALTKAIACGCKVVTNDFAVMGERSPNAVKDDNFLKELIDAIKNDNHAVDSSKYIKDNSWGAVASDWNDRLFAFEYPVAVSDRLEWIRSHCDRNAKIIDIGCNKGHLFYGWDRSNIYSVDIDKYDLPNFTQADASKPLPFADKQFDIAVLAEITEHTDDPVAVMREAMRVSKKLIITVPWEHKWTSGLNPFHGVDRIDEKCRQENVANRLELAKIGNPTALAFHDADNFEHLYHKQFYTPELMKEHLGKADIVDYKITEIRRDDWAWIGVVCNGQ